MPADRYPDAHILIVDDQPANVLLLERILESAGYLNVTSTSDPFEVVALCEQFNPDLILLDLHMPRLDGMGVLRELESHICRQIYLPILVLTADMTPGAKRSALSMGAKDFLTKPFSSIEVLLRMTNLLETRFLYLQLKEKNGDLENKVRQRTGEVEAARMETLDRLARAAEYRDDNTGQHTQRVGQLSALLAQGIGLPEGEVEVIRRAAALHDVGKIGIPDRILLKPGKLTSEEFKEIRTHTTLGAAILSGSRFPTLQLAEEIALFHHERWDGAGYGNLEKYAIPLASRIVAIADVFDVLTHDRPYRRAWPVGAALEEIDNQGGRQFDPDLTRLFRCRQWQQNLLELDRTVAHRDSERATALTRAGDLVISTPVRAS